jgi:hypothetical protein
MSRQRWEYKIEERYLGKGYPADLHVTALNNFGDDGWEIISVVPKATISPEVTQVVYLFKRPCHRDAVISLAS